MRVKFLFVLTICFCLGISLSVMASESEKAILEGIIVDQAGSGIAEASISIYHHPEKPALLSTTTDSAGKFHIRLTRSGNVIIRVGIDNADYDVAFTLYSHRHNFVSLKFDSLNKQLACNYDPYSNNYMIGPEQVESFDNDFIQNLPMHNSIDQITSLFSFTKSSDSQNIQGYGAGTSHFLIDSINTTDPFDGSMSTTVPIDAIEQYSIFLSEKPQIFSGNKGPVISVKTFEPTDRKVIAASIFYESSDFPDEIDALQFSKKRSLIFPTLMYGASAGSSFSYFGTASYKNENFSAAPGRVQEIETSSPTIFTKAGYYPDQALKIRGFYLGNFDNQNNFAAPDSDLFEIRNSGNVSSDLTQNSHWFRLSAEREFSTFWASSGVSFYRKSTILEPSDGNRNRSSIIDPLAEMPVIVDGSVEDSFADQDDEQLSFDASLTIPRFDIIGEHSLDLFMQYDKTDMTLEQGFNGGYRFDYSDILDRVFRRVSIHQDGKEYFTDKRNIDRFLLSVSDEWRIMPELLTLTAGFTWDKTTGGNDISDVFDWSTVSPHLAATISPFRNNHILFNIGYSRNYLKLLGLHIPGSPYTLNTEFYDAATNSFTTSPLNKEEIFGYQPEHVDQDIKRPYVDEFSIGINANVSRNTAISSTIKYWQENDIFEDIEQNLWPRYLEREAEDIRDMEYPYFILRPGLDRTLNPFLFLTNIDILKREYFGMDFSFRTRPTDNLMIFGQYTWSRLEGNLNNEPDDISGRTSVYNDPNERINSKGFLADDVRHTLRLALVYTGPWGVNASSIFRYDSGRPLDRLLLNPETGQYTIRADARGTVYREQGITTIDIRADKSFKIFDRHSITFILDIYNLTDDDTPVLYDNSDLYFAMPMVVRDPRRIQWGIKYYY